MQTSNCHGSRSLGSIPFSSVEDKSVMPTDSNRDLPRLQETLKVQPPPCWSRSPKPTLHGFYVPLPPCTFRSPVRSSPGGARFRRKDDPFFAAYLECTKSLSWQQGKTPKECKRQGRRGIGLSCKDAYGVRENSVVAAVPRLPASERCLERLSRRRSNFSCHGSFNCHKHTKQNMQGRRPNMRQSSVP